MRYPKTKFVCALAALGDGDGDAVGEGDGVGLGLGLGEDDGVAAGETQVQARTTQRAIAARRGIS